jgi:hypothetical protein
MGDMRLADIADLAVSCREGSLSLEGFCRDGRVSGLGWPTDVVEQFLFDHADYPGFLHDYGDLDLCKITWRVETIPCEEFIGMPTGASDSGCMEQFAADPDHYVRIRAQGIHEGVPEYWQTHGTWKRRPILVDRGMLLPPGTGLQVVEGRTRIGVLRGFYLRGTPVAAQHSAWVGRSSS